MGVGYFLYFWETIANFMKTLLIVLTFTTFDSFGQVFSLSDSLVSKGQYIALYDIYFEFNKENLQEIEQFQLHSLVDFLKKNKKVKIEIGVHTDFRGSDDYNLNISQKRADFLKNYLQTKGISSKRIIAIGFGETKPVIEYEDWKKFKDTHRCGYYDRSNRRITIVIL